MLPSIVTLTSPKRSKRFFRTKASSSYTQLHTMTKSSRYLPFVLSTLLYLPSLLYSLAAYSIQVRYTCFLYLENIFKCTFIYQQSFYMFIVNVTSVEVQCSIPTG